MADKGRVVEVERLYLSAGTLKLQNWILTDECAAPHTAADAAADTSCEVCFVAPRDGFALQVPCGHARFCESCANRVTVMDTCPVCRSNIIIVMRIFM